MRTRDTVWSIDLGPDDCLYRILRENGREQRVVYVLLRHLDLIPEESRTWGPGVIRELSKLADWDGGWKTLTISKDDSGIRTRANVFEPHRLPREQPPGLTSSLFNICDLEPVQSMKSRVTRVQVNGEQCFMKISRFEFEVAAIAHEVKVYETLMCQGSTLVPRLLGYVYEETPDRVIGFVLEAISGHYPSIKDLDMCRGALQRLHSLNIVHGDVNRYNMLLTKDGPKFIDLEVAEIDSQDGARMDKEMQGLEEQLMTESRIGCPW
ncbi:uncharacterized protein UV8b_08258 [Ustilaginoidea virens]|uniref:non-specific serine/threonine protein kinase n=1 Tax=Ustilaginoidea virens TaxID=1159556 RepID=A0A8E5ML92_USTVR|nr:uncharacterized protein UV8b_08258 [Ustilaginoidea virens]QUC24017.1 hypothetical protein UV8b_08258 [Ustilaginoidea virens]